MWLNFKMCSSVVAWLHANPSSYSICMLLVPPSIAVAPISCCGLSQLNIFMASQNKTFGLWLVKQASAAGVCTEIKIIYGCNRSAWQQHYQLWADFLWFHKTQLSDKSCFHFITFSVPLKLKLIYCKVTACTFKALKLKEHTSLSQNCQNLVIQ